MKSKRVWAILSILFVLVVAGFAQNWPTKPITIVCGQGAGGGTDQVVRAVAAQMEKTLGVPVNVVNRPGASGSLAIDFVAKLPADGYTLQANSSYNKPARALGHTKLIPWKDWYYFRTSSAVASYSVVKDSPIKDLKDLIAKAKAKPGSLTISNSGVGSIWHEGNSMLADLAGIKLQDVAYTSGSQASLAALQREVDVAGGGVHEHYQFLEAGQMRSLGVFSDTPITLNSGLVLEPIKNTIPEADGTFGPSHFIAVLRNTPPEIIKKIENAVRFAVNTPEFQKMCKESYLQAGLITGTEADKRAAYEESVTAWTFYDLKVQGFNINPAELGIPRVKDFESWWPPKEYKPIVFK